MRVYKKKVSLDPKEVKGFFDGRSKRLSVDPLTAVLYQDQNPDLAHGRDMYEKEKVKPMLDLNKDCHVLDVGCGIGRWADEISSDVGFYYGIDFAENFIDFATKKFEAMENVKFKVLNALDVSIKELDNIKFDRVIIAGLLLYLNDQQVSEFSERLKEVCNPGALIYLREPIGVDERLSLCNIWSEDLDQNYSAIYRTREEILDLIGDYQVVSEGDMYESNLNNRAETKQYFFILKSK